MKFEDMNFFVKRGQVYEKITAAQFFKKQKRKDKIINIYERSK
jgi:hypothetical protein